jgi:putrescine aminotransferase
MVGDRVAQVLMNSGDFNHGMTYSGHPVAAAVAAANLKILRDEGIVDRVRDDTGPYLQKKMARSICRPPTSGRCARRGLFSSVYLGEG